MSQLKVMEWKAALTMKGRTVRGIKRKRKEIIGAPVMILLITKNNQKKKNMAAAVHVCRLYPGTLRR